MFYTYAHYKPDGTIFYIGKGKGARAYTKQGRNAFWHNTIKKHPEYKVEILAHWKTEREALDHEIFLIDTFKSLGFVLTNLTFGGEGISGFKQSEETKQKMSLVRQGDKNHFFGRSHTEETKKAISEKKKENPTTFWAGKIRSEETNKKISLALLGKQGRPHTEETKKKLSVAHTGKKQAPPSEETRKKISEAIKASWDKRRENKMKVN